MADRAATLINKHDVFVKPNEQCRACSDIVMARIGNRRHGALSEVERQNALFEERKEPFNKLMSMKNKQKTNSFAGYKYLLFVPLALSPWCL